MPYSLVSKVNRKFWEWLHLVLMPSGFDWHHQSTRDHDACEQCHLSCTKHSNSINTLNACKLYNNKTTYDGAMISLRAIQTAYNLNKMYRVITIIINFFFCHTFPRNRYITTKQPKHNITRYNVHILYNSTSLFMCRKSTFSFLFNNYYTLATELLMFLLQKIFSVL